MIPADTLFGSVPPTPPAQRRQRRGWTRLAGGCGGVWRHTSGWIIRHCGHPTALWPYYGIDPARPAEVFLSGGYGLGVAFQKLAQAQEAVEAQIRSGPG